MHKLKLCLLSLLAISIILLVSCKGDKEIVKLSIISGVPTTVEINQSPDFSALKAKAVYNDGETLELNANDLTIEKIDTSTIGAKSYTVSYNGFVLTLTITVQGKALDTSDTEQRQIITAVSFPESLALYNVNKKDFKNQNQGYVVGDDNPFEFRLKLSVYSAEGEKLNISSYVSTSSVKLVGSEAALVGDELAKYVTIDEEENSFDFTEDAIGKTFTIFTRPRDGVSGREDEFTKSLTVTVVDGYNIYKAYELNYITNTDIVGSYMGATLPDETRTQEQIVKDFLLNEKGVTKPEYLSAIVIHSNLEITTSDIPAEYFYNRDRSADFYDYISVFNHTTSDTDPYFTIYGNYYAIYSYNLPCVVAEGYGNQDDAYSSSTLFRFGTTAPIDYNYDHTKYVTTVKNLMLVDDDPQSDNLENSGKAMRGIIALKSCMLTCNFENIKVQAYYVSYIADNDNHTINISDSIFYNSWQNHILLFSYNATGTGEKFDYANYKRITLNVTNSSITQSGGPVIITQTILAPQETGVPSGPLVNLSEDSLVESWVTGTEAWFKAMNIEFVATQIKGLDRLLKKQGSTFIREKVEIVNSKPETLTKMNLVMVNLVFPDTSLGWQGMLDSFMGNIDIDGKLVINGTDVMNMDDCVNNGKEQTFTDSSVSDAKNQSTSNHVFVTENGVGYTNAGLGKIQVTDGSLIPTTDDEYLTIYFYSLGLVFGNYKSI